MTDAFGAQKHITDTILKHYYWGILKQLHTFFGSFDVVGKLLISERAASGLFVFPDKARTDLTTPRFVKQSTR